MIDKQAQAQFYLNKNKQKNPQPTTKTLPVCFRNGKINICLIEAVSFPLSAETLIVSVFKENTEKSRNN